MPTGLRELNVAAGRRALTDPGESVMLVMDDADTFGDDNVRVLLDEIHLQCRDAGFLVVVAMTTFAAGKTYAPWFKYMMSARNGLLLTPDLVNDRSILDLRLPSRTCLGVVAGSWVRVGPLGLYAYPGGTT